MKAIAEYFRDLAAGDRFFGAEPPQPDSDMLHRIAEQTIQSRVNAEVSDNALILRQDHSTKAAAPVAAAVSVPTQAAPEAAPVVSQPEITQATAFTDSDSIAAKLQRIRAVVSRETAEPAEVTPFYSEDEHADEFSSPAVQATDEYEEDDAATPDATVDAAVETQEAETETAEPTPETEEAATDSPDALTSMVTSTDEFAWVASEPSAETEEVSEVEALEDSAEDALSTDNDEDANPSLETMSSENAPSENDVAEVVAEGDDIATTEAEDDADTTDTDEQDNAETLSAIAGLVADSAETDAPEVGTTEASDVTSSDVATETPSTSIKPRRRIIVQKVSRAEVEAAHATDVAEDANTASDELDPEAEAALLRELADVEADMEAEVETPLDSSQEDDIEARALAAAQSIQAEADTKAQAITQAAEEAEAQAKAKADSDALAAVMAEAAEIDVEKHGASTDVSLDTDATADISEADIETPEDAGEDENRASRIARRSILVEDEDAALNRLMDATSTRLSDDDEGAVRRASIAHLKAAVAATKADDSIAQAAADEDARELDQYRSDLARVVRPGRAKPRSDGASTSRPSPLVLVSEQRIDTPEADSSAAAALDVRPRRITSGNLALQEELEEEANETLFEKQDVESFGEYAARYAALELPDLLEAAAAHYTFIEETPSFTRPMLMRKISAVTTTEAPSREAGLRSFGSLLREGKIVKGDDGKFVISGKSRFTPEAQEAGA